MEKVIVLDFGGQYTHLIARRIRELGVYSEILPFNTPVNELASEDIAGIILSGGPRSVHEEDSPRCSQKILELNKPVLGICYGHQLIAYLSGGIVEKGEKAEFGKTILKIIKKDKLFEGLSSEEIVWMSHRDQVMELPSDFEILAKTENTPIAAFRHKKRDIYGVQFHPEVIHTVNGRKILENFLYKICSCKGDWRPEDFIEEKINEIRRTVGENERVVCALSGGVDSSTTAVIVSKAIGDRLVCIFVDHGFLREGEVEEVLKTMKKMGVNVKLVDAKERFMKKLKGVRDPEKKRRIIGEEFIRVFEEEARKIENVKWLAQGTIYPDRVESGRVGVGTSTIKSHHNVGALPERMNLKLIEPLRDLYKDEVRRVARRLGLPRELIRRHPFPGPGLAVRIIGEVTPEKLEICRKANKIVEEELKKSGWYDKVWQGFAVVGDDKWTGVLGDKRALGYIVTVRIVKSEDGMTADWVRIPYDVLERIGSRITNEVSGVTMVTYAISSKPCLLYTSPSPRDLSTSRMPSSA